MGFVYQTLPIKVHIQLPGSVCIVQMKEEDAADKSSSRWVEGATFCSRQSCRNVCPDSRSVLLNNMDIIVLIMKLHDFS